MLLLIEYGCKTGLLSEKDEQVDSIYSLLMPFIHPIIVV